MGFGDGNTSTDYSPSHTFTQAGTYNVSLMVTNGCSFDTTTVPIVIHPAPNVAFIHQPDSVCNFSPIQFITQSDVLANYAWSFGDGGTSNLTNPTHTYAATGNYTVTLTGTSLDGFYHIATETARLLMHHQLLILAINPPSGCVPLTASG
ncbi:MAG: PKD domain-containing protein [Crocinitomicaceae bacterium]